MMPKWNVRRVCAGQWIAYETFSQGRQSVFATWHEAMQCVFYMLRVLRVQRAA